MKWVFCFLAFFISMFSFSSEDYSKFGRGLVVPHNWKENAQFIRMGQKRVSLPDTFDWRQKVTLSPVKNQGNCGSCWAFSTTATWRDAMIVQAKENGDGSEQYVLDCNRQGYSCNGGYFDVSEIWVTPGAVREKDYAAYSAKKYSCNTSAPKFAKALKWFYIEGSKGGDPTVDDIKEALMLYGPVSVGVAAGNDWSNYRGGILQGSACTSKQLNHAVQIVGWGKGYWIVRNSWGTGWGEQGFIRIAFDCDGIGELPNVIVYKEGTPDPGPGPNPPPPEPCELPKASTGYPEQFDAVAGTRYLMGTAAVKGEKYVWKADPPFSNNAVPTTAQIYYKPYMTKTLTVTATNKCGSSSASTIMNIDVSLKAKRLKTFQ